MQLIYMENGLSVAALLFSLWQGVSWDWQRYGGWPFLAAMIGEWCGWRGERCVAGCCALALQPALLQVWLRDVVAC